MPEGDSVLPELTALQFTTLAAELCGLPRAEAIARSHQVLHYVGLGEARYRRLGSFSTGMRQRVTGVGGELAVESSPGEGTAISAIVPAVPA